MSKSTFASFFSGTMGILVALLFFFIVLPIMICSGCFGTLAYFGSKVDEERSGRTIEANDTRKAPENSPTNNSSENTSSKNPLRSVWVPIFEESGRGAKKTASFAVSSSSTTLQYQYTDTSDIGAAIFVVSIHDAGSNDVVDIATVNENGRSNADQTRLRLSPGTYYFDVNAANCHWELKVSEYLEESDPRAKSIVDAEIARQKEELERSEIVAERKKRQDAERRAELQNKVSELEKSIGKARDELQILKDGQDYETRTWNSKDGGYSIAASFHGSKEYKTVTLKKKSGELISVERRKLSHDDLVYLSDIKKNEKSRAEKLKDLPGKIDLMQDELESIQKELAGM